jgi:hypothetical protein
MSVIPLHLERIIEERWAAKLASLAVSAARKSAELSSREQFAKPSKSIAVVDPGDQFTSAR